ncbi:MAG: DJ-1 family glyoxalase III [Muribaculaceae bacterium]
MKTSYVFLADGFEEVEALTSVDLLRRAGIEVKTVSIKETLMVTGAHGISVQADITFSEGECAHSSTEWLILPGGMPGATNLAAHTKLCQLLLDHNARGGKIAAICASPAVVLASIGLLNGRHGVCYPGFEIMMNGCTIESTPVAVDDNIITGNGPAAASAFALAIIRATKGDDVANEVAEGLLLKEKCSSSDYYY